eukprot:3204996-Pyramimonas_sp.AAC.1
MRHGQRRGPLSGSRQRRQPPPNGFKDKQRAPILEAPHLERPTDVAPASGTPPAAAAAAASSRSPRALRRLRHSSPLL